MHGKADRKSCSSNRKKGERVEQWPTQTSRFLQIFQRRPILIFDRSLSRVGFSINHAGKPADPDRCSGPWKNFHQLFDVLSNDRWSWCARRSLANDEYNSPYDAITTLFRVPFAAIWVYILFENYDAKLPNNFELHGSRFPSKLAEFRGSR